MNALHKWKSQFRFYRIFFFSTLKLSVLISFLFAFLGAVTLNGSILDSIQLWFRLIPTAGLFFDYLYKEMTRKEEYYFYYNQGIGKLSLWIVTCCLSFVSCSLLYQIIRLCVEALK